MLRDDFRYRGADLALVARARTGWHGCRPVIPGRDPDRWRPKFFINIERKENAMSTTSKNAREDPIGTSNGGQANEDGKRRWYHPRPTPRCAVDLGGVNWSYWLVAVILVIFFLLPW
jgi:hypothetical protein